MPLPCSVRLPGEEQYSTVHLFSESIFLEAVQLSCVFTWYGSTDQPDGLPSEKQYSCSCTVILPGEGKYSCPLNQPVEEQYNCPVILPGEEQYRCLMILRCEGAVQKSCDSTW